MFVEGGVASKSGSSGSDPRLQEAPTEWIEREIGELAAHIAAAMCRWLELVAEFDRRGGYEAWGFHSCGAWVAWRCSLDPRSAREHVRVGRALFELPLLRERFARGELSYSKVRAITRVATPQIEAELVEMARYATAAQLERIVRGYRRAVSLESAEAAHRDRFLSWEWDEDGSLRIRGRLAPEDGALFIKAIEAGREAIRDREGEASFDSQGGSAEPEPVAVNDADALMEVAEGFFSGDSSPRLPRSAGWGDEAGQPGLALLPSPPVGARGRVLGSAQGRWRAGVPQARREDRSLGPLPRSRLSRGAAGSESRGRGQGPARDRDGAGAWGGV